MALPTTSVWEVRPGGTGSDTNGGGFDSAMAGTDYSRQDAKNSAGNNKSTTDAVGVGTTTLTSATASFTSAIVGNIIYITGTGATTGWYEVTAFTNSTTVTLDRSPGTGTGWTMNIGGALNTVSQAYTNATASNTIWIKATNTYTVTATLTLTGANLLPFQFIGYTTTRGDGGQITWTTSTNSIILLTMGAVGYNYLFQNIIFTNTASSTANCIDGGLSGQSSLIRFKNCTFSGFAIAIALGYANGIRFNGMFLFMETCEITSSTSHGVTCSGTNWFTNCYIHGNGGNGIHITAVQSGDTAGGAVHIDRCVIYDNTEIGVYIDQMAASGGSIQNYAWPHLENCAVVDNGSDGIKINSGSGDHNALVCKNTVIESNGGYGINNNSSTTGYLFIFYNNAFRANGSGNYNNFTADPTDITLSGEPFNSIPSDWTLNNTAGAGAACRNAGFPTSTTLP